jgi:thiol:disulfide interchange protein DsbD
MSMKTVLLSLLIFSPLALQAQDNPFSNPGIGTPLIRSSVLPAEEAFALTTFIEAPGTVVLLWEIEAGYYLYQKSLSVTDRNEALINLGELPAAATINDEYFGESKVYFERLLHRLPLDAFSRQDNTLSFTLHYQGCAQDRFCYPMQMNTVELKLPVTSD